ncbi:alanine:cation symporter family protein [Helicobacter sp. MIT 03-1614]|jgi:AGCS family alanine or glycine:cation symporter|uniref:Predicted amino-acid transport protein n=1 Tax=Helicobacter hepaticus (strain ATCC 51449 / 3B1) TaxID=235279 RepID=Q7VFP4_HELHP|nr:MULTISPECIES: alanine/glycine:cation symporter family protein [Helicobacter]AAP78228.1 predicted amino-acid transport protein [Helicobacter hepaticus ATCC 51449]TLD88929.1 alanine:cation symporter family protein [Helicobacter sp. MIT 03-1614]
MDILHNIIDSTNGFLYTYWLVFALIACGLYLSIRTRFIQLRFLKDAFMVLNERSHQKHISPFGALMISTASRVGIGNIVGVSIAIVSGGVGALFWMWVTALVGGASAFIESTLAQVYKRKDGEHRYKGGPAYYIETALHSRALGIIFAISLILCFTYGFNGLQSYTLTSAFEIFVGNEVFNEGGGFTAFVGLILAALVSFFFFGGGKSSATISSVLVPIMAFGYLVVALIVIGMNLEKIPMIFNNILKEAFNFQAIFSGFAGSAIVIGIKRGLFSNEAGMGSAPNAAAAAHTSHPAKQGMVQTLSVFIDTLIICSASAFMVLCSDLSNTSELKGMILMQNVMQGYFGTFGLFFVSIAIVLFAFTSLIGNYFYAEANFKFITNNKLALQIFRCSAVVMVFIGAQLNLQLAWDLADIFMGFMASVNIIAILLLSNIAIRVLKDYEKQRKEGKNPTFKAADVGIYNTEFWK